MRMKQSVTQRLSTLTRAVALASALLALTVASALAAMAALAPTSQALAATPALATPPACQTYTPAQRIYDCAGLLTSSEISALEAKARAVQSAGAPVVVFLQVKDATFDQTLSDAADLMARWNVESKSGAKDGLVILLNLQPGNLRHGQVALYAGKTLLNGAMPQDELARIYQQDMLPRLQSGDTAGGIGVALDDAAADLRYGGPAPTPPPPGQGFARAVGTIPFNALAVLLAALALGMGLLQWRRRREAAPAFVATPTAQPPSDLAPAVAGALITGNVSDTLMEATILDFARRGLLTLRQVGPYETEIHLNGDRSSLSGYERLLWQNLARHADGAHTISSGQLRNVAMGWGPALQALKRKMFDQGWYDADRGKKRRPLLTLMLICFILTLAGAVLGGLAQQFWPFLGAILCAAAGFIALGFAISIPRVTPEGQRMAHAARDYFAGLSAHLPGADVSEALPWLVAAGLANSYQDRLRMASNRMGTQYAAIYPCWLLMHTTMAPPPSTTGGGMVAGATGAAAGGGGAGGSF